LQWSALRRILPAAQQPTLALPLPRLRLAQALCTQPSGDGEGVGTGRNKRLGSRNPPVKYAQYTPRTLDESLRYMASAAYKEVYGERPVWFHYRRNLRGSFEASKPRQRCFNTEGVYIRANPCPLCRDEYLVLDYRHSDLLVQFLDPQSGLLLGVGKVQVCKHQYDKLQLEVEKAFDSGYLEAPVPFRFYDYSLYSGGRPLPADPFGDYASGTSLPHAQELLIEPPLLDIQRPKMPDRYAMEVGMQQRLRKKYKGKPTRPQFSTAIDEYLDKQIDEGGLQKRQT
uniref:ERIC3 protein n=3 Tax=Macrostomum lignano TaxID=282301 RepID=A0A1I8I1M8_9PLAT